MVEPPLDRLSHAAVPEVATEGLHEGGGGT